ncbi:MAG TPA: SRPBCC family protein [Polyangiaceae bacterium]|nr:SRPBCC family protein [Polyangiaceae bacterium]
MTRADRSHFVYVTYIRTTPAKLWEALTDPRFIHQYWFGTTVDCAWQKGSAWKMVRADGSLTDSGEIIEIDPPRRMVIRWQNEWNPELKAEGVSRCTIELEPIDSSVKLTITHEIERPDSNFIVAVSGGWPRILSNLKSWIETGEVAITTHPGHRAVKAEGAGER